MFFTPRRAVLAAILTVTSGIIGLSMADTPGGSPFREAQVQRQQVIQRSQNFRGDSNRNFDPSFDQAADPANFARQRHTQPSQVQREIMIAQSRDFRRVSNYGSGRHYWGHGGYYYGSRYPRYRYYGHRRYYGGYWGYPYWGYPYYSYGWWPWWGPSFGVTIGGVYPPGGYYDYGYYDGGAPIYRGQQVSEGARVSIEFAVQRKLAKLGYYRGPIDGDIGPASRRAIRRYQQENDLPVTGRIDRNLVASLGIS